MISFDHQTTTNPIRESNKNSSKKRSMEELEGSHHHEEDDDQIIHNHNHNSSKAKTMKWAFDTELHLQCPSPNSYDIKQCNFKLGKKYCHHETHMNLDLELNLPCGGTSSPRGEVNRPAAAVAEEKEIERQRGDEVAAVEGDQKEMVAAACRRCHMLVMMCKASPACPNCKFIHPPELTQPGLFIKPRRSNWLLC
ncbi:uncharacterized protein LOC124910521 [Impatiens glandulifera]|uniref:uncharacterized protein LOC124910521 n=1 Tax=Impatiens glandulifera TaxID=253017 RepID=UPI001FB10ED9|nr:uncharacterized protein LOC124910521 [Impatiens glandulifera]